MESLERKVKLVNREQTVNEERKARLEKVVNLEQAECRDIMDKLEMKAQWDFLVQKEI